MNERIKEFFFDEIDRGRLVFEDFPEYNDLLQQSMALFPDGDLPVPIGRLLDASNCISFRHGLQAGETLRRWIESPSKQACPCRKRPRPAPLERGWRWRNR